MEAPTVSDHRFCSHCGRSWPPDELARFGEQLICPECKNVFTQKLREGAAPAAAVPYAGFWIRVGAALIDAVILIVAHYVLQALLLPILVRSAPGESLLAIVISNLLGMIVGASYEGFLVHLYGATPGKMALGLRVIRPGGGQVSLGRAVGRYFAKLLSAVIVGIGYLVVAFDVQKRGLHDMICDTRVVRTR